MSFDCTKSMIWQGVNRILLKLTGGKPKFPQFTGYKIYHEGLKPKNLQITRTKSKNTGEKSKMTYITGVKHY